ncbi:MAG: hypothetical protein JXQ73_16240 [Phycisphaerae bacterium]|nr:hypothetical protein [Phycisphaerae bacterium]
MAEPTASIARTDVGTSATVESNAKPNLELTIPQGHLLVIGLVGQASWSSQAEGHVGFYLVVSHQLDGEWIPLGSDGAAGSRQGPSSARGRAIVPMAFDKPGVYQLRVVVHTIAVTEDSAGSSQPTEDRDELEIILTVLPGPLPSEKPVLPISLRDPSQISPSQWLEESELPPGLDDSRE